MTDPSIKIKDSRIFHIICLRFSSLGDVVLQSPIMSHLKSEYGENCQITLITSKEFAPLFQGHPHIHQVKHFSRKEGISHLFKLIKEINRERKIDFIFDLHNTIRANLVKWRFWKIPKIAVDKRALERKLLNQRFKIRLLKKRLIMTRVIEDFNFLWKKNFNAQRLSTFISQGHVKEHSFSSLPAAFSPSLGQETLDKFELEARQFIVLIPSAAHITKRWPIDRFKELAIRAAKKYLDYKIVILAGPTDDFCRVFDNLHPNIVNLFGKTSIKESTQIVGRARLCIGNDTGMTHIAEAQLTPSFMIMGPTSEEFGFYPHLKSSYAFSHPMSCRPCSSNGAKKCFREETYCLTKTSVEDVFQKLMSELT